MDRLERLDKFEEEMKHKEDHPPVPPKTKKVMRSVEKQRVNKVATLMYAPPLLGFSPSLPLVASLACHCGT